MGIVQFQANVTKINASVLNALVVAQSYLVTGGIAPTSGSLSAAQPATDVVVNNGTTAVALHALATTLTMVANSDNYVDLSNLGTYTVVSVANGANPPAVTANSIRLYKAVTNASVITLVRQLAPALATPPAAYAGGQLISLGSFLPAGTATTWDEIDPVGRSLFVNLACTGNRPVLILCSFDVSPGTNFTAYDLAISDDTNTAASSVLGTAHSAAYGAGGVGLAQTEPNFTRTRITMQWITPPQPAGSHRIAAWAVENNASGSPAEVFGFTLHAHEL